MDASSIQFVAHQLDALPDTAFTKLRILQPQVGCFGSCAHCSQDAGIKVWQITPEGLEILFSAIGEVTKRRQLKVSEGRDRKPGHIYAYLDNDVGMYPYIHHYVRSAARLLGVKTRISTVGFSALNPRLLAAHQTVANNNTDAVGGLRFSLNPYSIGYRQDRAQYTSDLAESIKTYRPVISALGHGKAVVRFVVSPLLESSSQQILDTTIDGHHVIASGPHMLVSVKQDVKLRHAVPTGKDAENCLYRFDQAAAEYTHITSDAIKESPVACAEQFIRAKREVTNSRQRKVDVYLYGNKEGPYYSINPNPDENGLKTGLRIFPMTEDRRKSGYINDVKPLMNAIIAFKMARGLDWKSPVTGATWKDIADVVSILKQRAADTAGIDRHAATHMTNVLVPLVETYIEVLGQAGLPPDWFFAPKWTIDGGSIDNFGRALTQFRGLAVTPDEQMSIAQDYTYGQAQEEMWRCTPIPNDTKRQFIGGKNTSSAKENCLMIQQMDPDGKMSPFDPEKAPAHNFIIEGIPLERLNRDDVSGPYHPGGRVQSLLQLN
jgi:hypothetical protein